MLLEKASVKYWHITVITTIGKPTGKLIIAFYKDLINIK